jgi:hypothetical protein
MWDFVSYSCGALYPQNERKGSKTICYSKRGSDYRSTETERTFCPPVSAWSNDPWYNASFLLTSITWLDNKVGRGRKLSCHIDALQSKLPPQAHLTGSTRDAKSEIGDVNSAVAVVLYRGKYHCSAETRNKSDLLSACYTASAPLATTEYNVRWTGPRRSASRKDLRKWGR